MTVRAYRLFLTGETNDIPGDRCAIARHRIDRRTNSPFFLVDGKVLCYNHAREIFGHFESIVNSPGVSEREMIRGHRLREQENAKRNLVTEMRKRGEQQPGFVYYIRIDQHIKIGFAADISRRMRAYPPSAVLLAAHPGTKATEKQMHQDFRAYLDRGREWFRPGKTLMAHIDGVLEQFGDPKILAYEYTKARRAG